MSDAGDAFRTLRDRAGAAFDEPAMHAQLDAAEHRVERARAWRAVMSTGVALILAAMAVLAVETLGGHRDATPPAHLPTVTPSPFQPIVGALELPCTPATVVPGNPIESTGGETLGGFEGWFNGTYAESGGCDSSDGWNEEIWLMADHPDTVWINTSDNTMLEAYYRTDVSALGVYGTLSGNFTIPNPDPSWPADSLILIDARTGEILITNPL